MKNVILIMICLLLCACTYTEEREVEGRKVVMIKKSKNAKEAVYHVPRSDGRWVAYMKTDDDINPGGGYDHGKCCSCVLDCYLNNDGDTGDTAIENCVKACNSGPCDGKVPTMKDLFVVKTISIDNLKLFNGK